jgi:hypothetical protein
MRVNPVDPLLYSAFIGMGMAFIELGRFDEAIIAGKKALRRNPSYSGGTTVSRPLSLISDGMRKPVRRRCVCLRSILPSQYPPGWGGADNHTRSC